MSENVDLNYDLIYYKKSQLSIHMSTNHRRQKLQEALVQLNVTGRAGEVFFALLEHGTMTASDLAKRVRSVPRTSIYDILNTLLSAGFVSTFTREERIFYQVENIEHVVDRIEEQKRELTEKQNTIRGVADLFQQCKFGTTYEPGIRYFEGKQGILAIHREVQNARQETRTIVDIASVYRVFPRMVVEDNLKDFQTYKILKKDLMIQSKEAKRYLEAAPMTLTHQVKWLPPAVAFQTDTLIWSGHVAIIDYSDRLSGIVIDNPSIAATFIAWFEMMWTALPS